MLSEVLIQCFDVLLEILSQNLRRSATFSFNLGNLEIAQLFHKAAEANPRVGVHLPTRLETRAS